MKRASRTVALALALAAPGLGACGSDPPAPRVCPDDALTACPSPAPAFAADAAPILAAHCAKCHTPGGTGYERPFQTYDQIAPLAGDINLALQTCAMPPAPEPLLGADERQKLFGWILCGALND